MKEEATPTSPEQVYKSNVDKQRVVITGSQASMITAMVIFILDTYHREFDFVSAGKVRSGASDAPLLIIQEREQPASSILGYRHHIGIISEFTGNDPVIAQFADATPKGGTLIFTETEPVGSVGKVERPGITAIPYKTYAHKADNGSISLVSSKNELVPIRLSGDQPLRNLSAAKEILKKIGITSGQFYSAISRFEA